MRFGIGSHSLHVLTIAGVDRHPLGHREFSSYITKAVATNPDAIMMVNFGIDSVTARKRTVTLDILATDRQARAVTAQFVLRFDTTGQKTGATTVRGRLFLTRKRGAWRVFGYDVAKGAR